MPGLHGIDRNRDRLSILDPLQSDQPNQATDLHSQDHSHRHATGSNSFPECGRNHTNRYPQRNRLELAIYTLSSVALIFMIFFFKIRIFNLPWYKIYTVSFPMMVLIGTGIYLFSSAIAG